VCTACCRPAERAARVGPHSAVKETKDRGILRLPPVVKYNPAETAPAGCKASRSPMTFVSLLCRMPHRQAALCGLTLMFSFAGCQPPPRPAATPDATADSDASPTAADSDAASNATEAALTGASGPSDGAGMPAGTRLKDGGWWDIPYPSVFDASQLNRQLPVIRVQGNRFVDESGATVVFQGVNISDPDKLERDGHW